MGARAVAARRGSYWLLTHRDFAAYIWRAPGDGRTDSTPYGGHCAPEVPAALNPWLISREPQRRTSAQPTQSRRLPSHPLARNLADAAAGAGDRDPPPARHGKVSQPVRRRWARRRARGNHRPQRHGLLAELAALILLGRPGRGLVARRSDDGVGHVFSANHDSRRRPHRRSRAGGPWRGRAKARAKPPGQGSVPSGRQGRRCRRCPTRDGMAGHRNADCRDRRATGLGRTHAHAGARDAGAHGEGYRHIGARHARAFREHAAPEQPIRLASAGIRVRFGGGSPGGRLWSRHHRRRRRAGLYGVDLVAVQDRRAGQRTAHRGRHRRRQPGRRRRTAGHQQRRPDHRRLGLERVAEALQPGAARQQRDHHPDAPAARRPDRRRGRG